jgi:hypothetical protein
MIFRGKMENAITLLKNTSSWLSEIKRPLESISKDNEPRFIKLGQELQSIYSDTKIITHSATEAASLIEGESDDNLLMHIDSLAEVSMNNIEAFRNGLAEMFPKFESCINYMKVLNEACPGIIKIAKMLNMIALNISVESSRSETCEDMFRIFVQEIKELAGKASSISYKIKEDSENSKASQENDFLRILERRAQLDKTADKAREIISENAKRVEEVMSLSHQVLRESEIHSKKISELVGEVVMAIQFHDIARQQIDHVIEALQDIKNQIGEIGESGEVLPVNPEENSNLLGQAHSILSLQVLQIQQVATEVDAVYEKILTAFEEIAYEIESIVNGLGRLERGNVAVSQEHSAFNLLLSGFGNLEATMANGEELERQIDESMKRTSESASSLSKNLNMIEDLSMQFHIKSINALVMSKRLGKSGVTLAVLAEYVTEGAKKSDSFALKVVEILRSLQAAADDLNRLSLKTDKGPGDEGQSDRYFAGGISFISEIYNRFLKNAEETHQYSMALRKKISGIGLGLSFLNNMKSDLEKCLNRMREVLETLGPFSSLNQNITCDLSKLKDRYTMQLERGIHQKAFGSENISFEVNIKKAKVADHDLGDNVELF